MDDCYNSSSVDLCRIAEALTGLPLSGGPLQRVTQLRDAYNALRAKFDTVTRILEQTEQANADKANRLRAQAETIKAQNCDLRHAGDEISRLTQKLNEPQDSVALLAKLQALAQENKTLQEQVNHFRAVTSLQVVNNRNLQEDNDRLNDRIETLRKIVHLKIRNERSLRGDLEKSQASLKNALDQRDLAIRSSVNVDANWIHERLDDIARTANVGVTRDPIPVRLARLNNWVNYSISERGSLASTLNHAREWIRVSWEVLRKVPNLNLTEDDTLPDATEKLARHYACGHCQGY